MFDQSFIMKYSAFLLLILTVVFACNNDIDKNITTDLQVEGNEIFAVGLALEESLYYAFLTLDRYRSTNDTLPGCPAVKVDETERKVTLTFSAVPDCTSQKLNRSGEITLQYFFTNALETNVVMVYDNYKFKNFGLQGTRRFKQIKSLSNPHFWTETFEEILVIDQFDSSTKLSGNSEHQLKYGAGGSLLEFSSTGSLTGRNITGRKITMDQLRPKTYKKSCIDLGFVMPATGAEKWEIFRTERLSVSHTVEFTQEEDCKSEAKINLSDGRTLILSQ